MNALEKHEQLLARTLEVERAVLGGILVDPDLLHAAREHISAADFYRAGHRTLFEALTRLAGKGEPIDTVMLAQELTAEELEVVGGPVDISELVKGVPRAMNVAAYAREVAEKSTLRAIERTAQRILTAAHTAEDDVSALLEEAERSILTIRDRHTRTDIATPLQRSSASYPVLEEMVTAGGALRGVPTGLKGLDADLRGLRKGNLITIGARPSMGKSALVVHFAMEAGASSDPALVFSLEMSLEELNLRELTTRAGVNSWRLTHGKTTEWELRRLGRALDEMGEGGVHVVDAPTLTVGQINAISRRAKAQHGLSVIVVDYLQLITPERHRGERAENRTIELGTMSRALKGIARELQVPLVLVSQLSRNSESRPDKRPQLSDLRESGAIEQDSDVVLLLHRPNAYPDIREKGTYKDHYAEINIAKQRNGPTGIVTVAFYREQTRFADYSEDPQAMPKRHVDPALPLEATL